MPKIKTYPVDTNVTLDDFLIGTDPDDSNATKSYSIADILALGNVIGGMVGTLQQVTKLGNSTSNGFYVTGASSFTNQLNLSGDVKFTGSLFDSTDSSGTNGQIMSVQSGKLVWINSSASSLEAVTTVGNTSTKGIILNTIGLVANALSTFTEKIRFNKDISLNGDSGTSGFVLTSAGAGVVPTWAAVSDSFSMYKANGSITDAARVITGIGTNSITFNNFGSFVISGTTTASITTTGAITLVSATEATLEGQTKVIVRTPRVIGALAAVGNWLKLDALTGEVEFRELNDVAVSTDRVAKWNDTLGALGQSTILDNNATTSFNGSLSASQQVNIATTVSEGLRILQSGTVNPTYGINVFNSGASSGSKYGIQSVVTNGTAGSEQIAFIGMAGTSSTAGTSFGNTQVAILGIAGDGVAGQDSYAGQLYAIENNADDNYGIRIEVTNAGAGNSYLGLFKDGNEGLGKVIVSDATGRASWGALPATALTALESLGAGAGTISVPTAGEQVVNKDAITGGGDTDTLPNPASIVVGQIYLLKDNSGGAATDNWRINSFGAELFDGQAYLLVNSDWGKLRILWNGTSYNIIGS